MAKWGWFSGGMVVNEGGMYGIEGTLAPGNIPGSRGFMSGWTNKTGNLGLFGGYGLSGGIEGDLSDLWMYMP
jgi:hypothetical protein